MQMDTTIVSQKHKNNISAAVHDHVLEHCSILFATRFAIVRINLTFIRVLRKHAYKLIIAGIWKREINMMQYIVCRAVPSCPGLHSNTCFFLRAPSSAKVARFPAMSCLVYGIVNTCWIFRHSGLTLCKAARFTNSDSNFPLIYLQLTFDLSLSEAYTF